MKNRRNYVTTKSNLTLTQSGLLPVLLKRQRHKVIELAQRRPHGRALGGNRSASHLNPSPKQVAMSHQIHRYGDLRQQIHDDLPIQHPEWVEPNGESLMCLMKLLDSWMQMGMQRVSSYSSSRLRRGTKV